MFLPACAYSDEAIHMYAAKKLTFREQKLDCRRISERLYDAARAGGAEGSLQVSLGMQRPKTALLKVWLLHQQGRL